MISVTATVDAVYRASRTPALMGLALWACACVSLPKPSPIQYPSAFLHESSQLTNSQTRPAAYKRLFPELTSLQAFGIMTVTIHGEREKQSFQITFFGAPAPPPSGTHPPDVRLKATHQLAGGFADIMVREGIMTVVLVRDKAVFQGPAEPHHSFLARLFRLNQDASPLARVLGLEPGDLARILAIGAQVALNEMTAADTHLLKPVSPNCAGGLRSVTLDPMTGLPSRAIWVLKGGRCVADYPVWDFFTDSKTGQKQLMPAQVKLLLRRGWVTIELDIRTYNFNKKPSTSTFTLNSDSLKNYNLFPLESLKKVF